jgi:hypothetical protein
LVEYVPVDWSPDDLELPVHSPAGSEDSVSACLADWAVDSDDSACPASPVVLKAAPGDSAVGFRVDFRVPTEDDLAPADFRDEAADTPGDDIASCRDNPVD